MLPKLKFDPIAASVNMGSLNLGTVLHAPAAPPEGATDTPGPNRSSTAVHCAATQLRQSGLWRIVQHFEKTGGCCAGKSLQVGPKFRCPTPNNTPSHVPFWLQRHSHPRTIRQLDCSSGGFRTIIHLNCKGLSWKALISRKVKQGHCVSLLIIFAMI